MSLNQRKLSTNRISLYVALGALLLIGLWLRLRFIHTVRLYPDEFVTLLAIQMIGQKGLPIMPSGLFYDHGLLFSYLGWLASLLGPAHLAARYASLACGMLTLVLTFFIGRRWFSPAVGLIAVAGLAVAPTAIQWSGRARMYALLQLLVLLALWLVYEGIVYHNASRRWAGLLAYLGACLTQFVGVALAPALVVAGGISWFLTQRNINFFDNYSVTQRFTEGNTEIYGEDSKILKFFSVFLRASPRDSVFQVVTIFASWRVYLEILAFIAVLVISFLVKRLGQPKGVEALPSTGLVPGLAQVAAIYGDLSFNLAGTWQAISPFYLTLPALIFTALALLAMVISLIAWLYPPAKNPLNSLLKQPTASLPAPSSPFSPLTSAVFLGLILLTTTLGMFFVSPERRDDKYLFMLLPVLCLLGAYGICQVSSVGCQVSKRWYQTSSQFPFLSSPFSLLSFLLCFLASALILFLTWPGVQSLLANHGDDYEAAFAYVQAHWQPGDKILTGTPAAAMFYLGHNDFYGVQRRGGYDYRLLTINGQAVDRWLGSPAIRTETDLHETLANHHVWLVLERWGLQCEYYDLPFQQQLLAQTDYETESQGIFILRSKSDPRPIALNPARPADAILGDMVRLTGYTLEPDQPAPGQTVRLTLYWQALAPMPYDYTVFVHLRQPGGGNVAQADHRPLGQLYPTTLWPAGEIIRESSDRLSIPPDLLAGDYELWTGLYLLETGERLPVQNDASGENAVRLGMVRIRNER